jgi:hypothetical protein
MYDDSGFLETSKRTLSPDEINAMCEIYAPMTDPPTCALDENVGCAIAAVAPDRHAARPRALDVVVAVALFAVGRWRRRGGAVSARRRARS